MERISQPYMRLAPSQTLTPQEARKAWEKAFKRQIEMQILQAMRQQASIMKADSKADIQN